jgi:hypothetical protein
MAGTFECFLRQEIEARGERQAIMYNKQVLVVEMEMQGEAIEDCSKLY